VSKYLTKTPFQIGGMNPDSARTEKKQIYSEEKLNHDSEEERAIEDYQKFYEEFKEDLEAERTELRLDREWHSFDEGVIRERYDDFDVSPSELSESVKSFPDSAQKMKDPDYLAGLEQWREWLKSYYHYNNCYLKGVEIDRNPNRDSQHFCRRTQTFQKDLGFDAEPFDFEAEYSDEDGGDWELDS